MAWPFFGTGMKTDLFQSCGHCWVFQICWHIECNTFTASPFRIWNSSSSVHNYVYSLRRIQDTALRLHCCFLTAPPCFYIPSLSWLGTVCSLKLRGSLEGRMKPVSYKQNVGDTARIYTREDPMGSCWFLNHTLKSWDLKCFILPTTEDNHTPFGTM